MKKFAAIGLGNFGMNMARVLVENGCEVLGIDKSKTLVNQAKEFLTHVVVGDASNREVLETLSLTDFDGAIVSIGQDMAPSILITLYLKEIGVSNIVVRAISEDHGKILSMIGVNDIVFPEKEMAARLANRLSLKNAVDYLPLGEDYGILEVTPPSSFLGKNLKELEIRQRFNCHVIGIKSYITAIEAGHYPGKAENVIIAPSADEVITDKSVMIIVGRYQDIEKMRNIR